MFSTHGFPVNTPPAWVAVGNFDSGSDPDLALANVDDDTVSVLLGGSGGSFGARNRLHRREWPGLDRGRRFQLRLRP